MSLLDLFLRQKPTPGPPEWIIAGLGNPGRKYELSRHNAGFLTLDILSEKHSIKISKIKFHSLYGRGAIANKSVLLLKPQTFMNASGQAIASAASYYKIPMERVIIIYDDVSLPVGKLRIRTKGSAGGHNGIKDIIRLCETDEFPRIKIGIGSPPTAARNLTGWVLGGFGEDEKPKIISAFDRAALAAEKIMEQGAARTSSEYN